MRSARFDARWPHRNFDREFPCPALDTTGARSIGECYGRTMRLPFLDKALELQLPSKADALPGRSLALPLPKSHFVLGTPLQGDFAQLEQVLFGMGCFWGAERKFWELAGVHTTAVGYAGGLTPNPTYEEVCGGLTGHTEVVLVVFEPQQLSFEVLLQLFWETHNPTQGMRQGNDVGTQYRSAIYTFTEPQLALAARSKSAYAERLQTAGFGGITTELRAASEFYYAEPYHQQYLGKNPRGYCGLKGTGVSCPVGLQP